jgi:glycine/D-amino acid oxidase-like deaminating enzyme
MQTKESMKDVTLITFNQVRLLEQNELPDGMSDGLKFTSVCINTALYLPWLASQCLKLGVKIRRGVVSHISEAASLHHSGQRADIVINCTGLSSLRLGGVEDSTLFPSRGQIVLVRNDPMVITMVSSTDDGPSETTYTMTRAGGGGTVLGGSSHRHSWESQPDPSLALRIMKRAVKLCPQMVPEGKGIEALSVIRHGVGLRPMRENGIRIEKETITGNDGQKIAIVHNYGHGGAGYQTSYGVAQVVEKLVKESLGERSRL